MAKAKKRASKGAAKKPRTKSRASSPKKAPKKKAPKKAEKPARAERIRARAKRQESVHDRLFGALEMIRDIFERELGMGTVLHARTPPAAARGTPWALVGRFAFEDTIYYGDLYLAFLAMEASRRLESKVGAQRLARIQSRYSLRGKRHEYTIAEIGPWELVISRAVERTNPDGVLGESLAAMYDAENEDTGEISSVLVWLSSVSAKEVDLGLPF